MADLIPARSEERRVGKDWRPRRMRSAQQRYHDASGSFLYSSRRRHTRSVSAFLLNRSSDLPTKSSNLSETAEVPACNVPSRSPLPALAIAPETKLGTASSGLGTLEP